MTQSDVLEHGLFDDDMAREARDQYDALLRAGVAGPEALDAVLYEQRIVALMLPSQAALLWLALAATEHRLGRVTDLVRRRAAEVLGDEGWLAMWASNRGLLRKRRAACDVVRRWLAAGPVTSATRAHAPHTFSTHKALPLTGEKREAVERDLELIRNQNPGTDFDGPSDPLVLEVATDIERYRAGGSEDAGDRREMIASILGLIWGEQLRRTSDWVWMSMRDQDGDESLALVHRDRRGWFSPFSPIMVALDHPDGYRNVAWELFEAIRDGRGPIGAPGTLIPLTDFAGRLADRQWPEQRDALVTGRSAPDLAASSMRSMLDILRDTGESTCDLTSEMADAVENLAAFSGGSNEWDDDDAGDDADDGPGEPPTTEDVVRRTLILHHMVSHAFAATRLAVLPEATAEEAAARQQVAREVAVESRRRMETLRASGLWTSMTDDEHTFVETQADEVDTFDVLQISWRAESLGCLFWAFGLIDEIPAYDTLIHPAVILAICHGTPDLGAALTSAGLRPPDEIEHARTVAEVWHWRSRTRQVLEENRPFPPMPPVDGVEVTTWDGVVRITAPRAAENGFIPPPIDEDFPAFGRAYRDLSAEEWSQAQSIAVERHFALNWMRGHAPGNRWEDTLTGT